MDTQREHTDTGFSLLELLISLTILLVMAGATLSLYSTNLQRYSAEQQTAEMNQTARNALGLMCLEVQQAGSHPDVNTTLTGAVNGSTTVQTITVASSANIYAGDYVTIDAGAPNEETFKVSAVGANTLTGKVTQDHNANALVCLFAQPYKNGIINSLAPNSSVTNNHIKFFGDINNDGTLYYVEYTYNAATNEILRSITPLTGNNKAAATPIAENVSAFNVTLYSDNQGNVSKVRIKLTVTSANTVPANQIHMSNTVLARSVAAASNQAILSQQYSLPNRLPVTPAQVVSWAN